MPETQRKKIYQMNLTFTTDCLKAQLEIFFTMSPECVDACRMIHDLFPEAGARERRAVYDLDQAAQSRIMAHCLAQILIAIALAGHCRNTADLQKLLSKGRAGIPRCLEDFGITYKWTRTFIVPDNFGLVKKQGV